MLCYEGSLVPPGPDISLLSSLLPESQCESVTGLCFSSLTTFQGSSVLSLGCWPRQHLSQLAWLGVPQCKNEVNNQSREWRAESSLINLLCVSGQQTAVSLLGIPVQQRPPSLRHSDPGRRPGAGPGGDQSRRPPPHHHRHHRLPAGEAGQEDPAQPGLSDQGGGRSARRPSALRQDVLSPRRSLLRPHQASPASQQAQGIPGDFTQTIPQVIIKLREVGLQEQ